VGWDAKVGREIGMSAAISLHFYWRNFLQKENKIKIKMHSFLEFQSASEVRKHKEKSPDFYIWFQEDHYRFVLVIWFINRFG
jgi:hypothetical protein